MHKQKLELSLLLSLLLSISFYANAADTAVVRILRMPKDTARVMAFVDLGWLVVSESPKKAVQYADLVLSETRALKWEKGEAEALILKAKAYDYLGRYNEAIPLNFNALAISNKLNLNIIRARAFRQLGAIYQIIGKYSFAIIYLEKSYAESKNAKYLKGMASALSDLGVVYRCKSDYNKALDYFFKSIAIKEKIKDYKNSTTTYRHIGTIYSICEDYEKAIDFQMKALLLSQKIKDKWAIALSLNYIGELYIKLNNYNKAFSYLKEGLELNKEIGDQSSISANLSNMGLAYLGLNRMVESLKYQKQALALKFQLNDIIGQSLIYSRIGNFFLKIENYDSSAYYYNKVLDIDKQLQNQEYIIEDFNKLSYSYYKKGLFELSQKFLDSASIVLRKNPSTPLNRDILELQSQLFEKQKNYKASLKTFKHFIQLRDSILNQDKKTAVALKEAKFEFDKKALADSIKNHELQQAKDIQIKFQTSELQKQKITQYALFAGLAFLIALGWLLYSRYKAIGLQKISERKLLLLQSEQAIVAERTRIADEMHDDVGADLSNLLLKIRVNENAQKASRDVDFGGLKNSTNSVIHKIDEIIWSLNAHRDNLSELINFIVKYFSSLIEENKLDSSISIPDAIPNFSVSAKQRRDIFLTVKEILNNALKHAKASKIEMGISIHESLLHITITDNGKGFDIENANSGNGLRSMDKRIIQNGGKLKIESDDKKGTRIKMEIQLS